MKTKILSIISIIFFAVGAYAQQAATIDAGRTSSSIDVSATGAATYNIPIAVPPGINGVVPQVALNYNSQGGNGLAGYGWNVSGISSISRIAATQFHDGFVGGINFDDKDRFALDGQRLIAKTGVYGADGTEYQTENFSNLKVISKGTSTNGPRFFEVYYPDGSISYYGFSSLSRIPTDYPIITSVNSLDLRINYSYYNENNAWYIGKISYGINRNDSRFDINEINFVYKARQRSEQAYISGTGRKINKILSEINVEGYGVVYRNYILTHNEVNALKYERLIKIQEFSGDKTKAFEPILFNYGNSYKDWSLETEFFNVPSGVNPDVTKTISADFTGNGKLDFIFYNKNYKNEAFMFSDDNKIINEKRYVDKLNVGDFEDILPITFLKQNNTIRIGEGFAVVKEPNATTVNFEIKRNNHEFSFFSTYTVNEYSKILQNLPLTPRYFNNSLRKFIEPQKIVKEYFSGDFNGDGLSDVLVVSKPFLIKEITPPSQIGPTIKTYNSESQVYFVNLDRRTSEISISLSIGFLARNGKPDYIFTNDFNGDGKTDIAFIKEGLAAIYTLDTENKLKLLWETPNENFKMKYSPIIGDFNGDGKADMLYPTDYSENRFFLISSTGKSFVGEVGDCGFSSKTQLYAYDINSDGKTDIVSFSLSTWGDDWKAFNEMDINSYHNQGITQGSTFPGFLKRENYNRIIGSNIKTVPVFFNFDKGNSNLDFLLLSNITTARFSFYQDLKKDIQLNTIVQDGVTHTFKYNDLIPIEGFHDSRNEIGYMGKTNQVYPNIDIARAPGFKVVNTLSRTFNNSTIKQIFGYRAAVSNTQGLGFLGFGETIRSTWYGDSGDPRQYNINISDPKLRGASIKSFTSYNYSFENTVKDAIAPLPNLSFSSPITTAQSSTATQSITLNPGFLANGANGTYIAQITNAATGINDGATGIDDYISRIDYTYETQLLPNKVFKNTLTSIATKDQLNGTNTTIAYTYDAFNNISQEFSNFSGQGTKNVAATYQNSTTTPFFIGRPLKKITTLNNSGDIYTTEVQFTYDTGFLPTVIRKKGHNTSFNSELLTYDAFGNITVKTNIINNGASRTIKMEYDPGGRFLIKQTDVEGLFTTYTYNLSNGNVISQFSNTFNQTSLSEYDNWGRLKKSTDPLGVSSYRDYVKSGSNIIKTEKDDTGLEKQSTINALGQTIEEKSKNVFGQWVGIKFEFDNKDRPTKKSEPAFGGNYTQSNETYYDDYNRPEYIIAYTGKTTDITYEGLTTTINDGTKTTITTKNALGQITETTDPGGTIKNAYHANGNLKTATYEGSTQSIEYDGWGRKTKLTDPSAGVYTYTYNDFGETTRETTPKGTTNYSYDANGKLTGKLITGTGTNMSYVYSYNPTTKLPTALNLTNADGNNTQYTYFYDAKFRPQTTIESNPYATFTKIFSYDMFGRLNTETSTALNKANNRTASKIVKNNYAYGQLVSINDNDTGRKIWEVAQVNARGQVIKANLGTAITQTNAFDEYGLPQEIKTNRIGSNATELMKLNYSFNAIRGNLISKINSVFAHNEQFSYDNLDRLLKSDVLVNGQITQSQSQTYDQQGRTTTKSDLGTFTYNGYQHTGVKDIIPTAISYYESRPTQQITYNAFKSPTEIYEAGKDRISYFYNAGQDRSTMFYGGEQTDPLQRRYRRHYSEDGSMEITVDREWGVTNFIFYLGGDAYTAPAIWREQLISSVNIKNLYFLHRDYQGTILQISTELGQIQENRLFDAWGNVLKITDRNNNNILTTVLITDRGYTGHEHLFSVGIIHMNGRLYDPLLHRFLSPDNYIQDPSNTQNFNRYGYVLNNPLTRIDPSGELIVEALLIYSLFFTDPGYQIQKYISPIAVKIDIQFGTHQKGLGFDISVGIPKTLPVAARAEFGSTYYWKNYGDYKGWEQRIGWEASLFGMLTYSRTKYTAGEFSQTVGRVSYGIPSFTGVDVSNDLFGDGNDRFRTSHVRFNFGPVRFGNRLFTGDPGTNEEDIINNTYTKGKGPYSSDPNKYRNGILYFGVGPIEMGWDSEGIRNRIQNLWIHDLINSPHFLDLRGTDLYKGDRFFFQFGWGGMW